MVKLSLSGAKVKRKTLHEVHPDFYEDLEEIASNIKRLILRQNFDSVTRFCDETGLSRSPLTEILNGRNAPSLVSLLAISRALNEPISKIVRLKKK